jgi:hypothetical protein
MNPEPPVIAEVGGAVVAEQGPLVLVVDRGTGPTSVVAFLFGIFALILGGFGAVAVGRRRGRGHTPHPTQPFPTAAHL